MYQKGFDFFCISIFVFILFLIPSCNTKQDNTDGLQYNIDLTDPILKTAQGNDFYKRVKSVNFIPLETRNECLIGSIIQVKFFGDQILIMNTANSNENVLIFDTKGVFIRKVGNVGKGPGEYTDAFDFDIDKETGDIIILAPNQKKLFKYSNDGTFLKSIKLEPGVENVFSARFSLTDNMIITNCEGLAKDLIVFDFEGKLLGSYFEKNRSYNYNLFTLTKTKDKILYNNSQNDTVYQVESGNPIPYFYVDFGDKAYSPDKRSGEYYSKGTVLEIEKYIYLTFSGKGNGYCALLNKDNGDYEVYKWREEGLFGTSYPRINTSNDNGDLVSVLFPVNVYEQFNEMIKSPLPGFTFETTVSSQLGIEDNPVIMIMTLR